MTTPPDTGTEDAPSGVALDPVREALPTRADGRPLPRMPGKPEPTLAWSDGALTTFHFTGTLPSGAPTPPVPVTLPTLESMPSPPTVDLDALVARHLEALRRARAPHVEALHHEVRRLFLTAIEGRPLEAFGEAP